MNKVPFVSFFIFLISTPLQAKTHWDYFTEAQEGVCKPLFEKGGDLALDDCATLMAEDSEKKLTQKIAEVKAKLKEVNRSKVTKAFLQEQKSWQAYKKDRCAYLTSGTEYGSQAYSLIYRVCQGVENYRRIDALHETPSTFP